MKTLELFPCTRHEAPEHDFFEGNVAERELWAVYADLLLSRGLEAGKYVEAALTGELRIMKDLLRTGRTFPHPCFSVPPATFRVLGVRRSPSGVPMVGRRLGRRRFVVSASGLMSGRCYEWDARGSVCYGHERLDAWPKSFVTKEFAVWLREVVRLGGVMAFEPKADYEAWRSDVFGKRGE